MKRKKKQRNGKDEQSVANWSKLATVNTFDSN